MADGHFPTLVSKDRDANSALNPIFTSVSDGTDTLLVNADGSINVTVTGGASNTQYAEDSVHASDDIGTVALVVRKDTIGSNVDADGDYATLLQDANGRLYVQIHDGGNSITVDGTVNVGNAAGASAVNIQDGGNSITVDGTVAVSSVGGTVTVAATDLDIRDLTLAQDAVKVSGNSSANSQTNPIFVQMVMNAQTGEFHNYNTASAVAADATSNHDYTVTSTAKLTKITVASSGACKFEIQTGPVASLATVRVGFIPHHGGCVEYTFNPAKEVPNTSTGTIRIIRTNRENQAQDLYSSIEGIDN